MGWRIRESVGAPPLNLGVMVSPHALLPLSPLGLICDEREVWAVISNVDTD